MAFCPNCGTQANGRFCPNCGSQFGGSAAGAGPSRAAFAAPGLTENIASTLCYLLMFVTGIIFLLLAPYNRNRTVRFHAWQAIFGSLALFVLNILFGIVTRILWAGHAGWLAGLIWPVYDLAVFAGWLYLMYMTFNNRKVVLPVIGPLAEKRA